MRTMNDSTSAVDIPLNCDLVMGYVDGSSRWSDADWQRFPGKTLVRLCIFNDRLDADVIDIEPGNNDAVGAVPWVRAKWLQGDVPTVYCFTDLGPVGYRIGDVRRECDAAGVKRPLFIVTDFDNDPTLPDDPEVIGKQYANDSITGGHYDTSVVADHWPGVDEMDAVTKDEFEQWKANFQQLFVAPTLNTLQAHADAINHLLQDDAMHGNAQLAEQITKVGVALEEAALKLQQSAAQIPQ